MTTSTRTQEIGTALDKVLGRGTGSALGDLFTLMAWAEDEIKAAQKRHPTHSDLIFDAFKFLGNTWLTHTHTPPGNLETLYRAHCRELLDRIGHAGKDTQTVVCPATNAEILMLCSDTSLKAPLGGDAFVIFAHTFKSVFGEAQFDRLGISWEDVEKKQSHPHALKELLADLRQKFRYKNRDCTA